MIGLPQPLGCRSRAVLPSAFAYIRANSEGTSISTTYLLFSVPHSAWWTGLLHAYRPPHCGGECRPHYLDQRAEEFAWVTGALRPSPLDGNFSSSAGFTSSALASFPITSRPTSG